MIAQYPMLDMLSDHFTRCYSKPIVGVPNYPPSVVEKFLANMSGAITEADPPTRLDLAIAAVQNGCYLDFMGDDPDLFVFEELKRIKSEMSNNSHGRLFPPLYLLHGEQDSAVPVEGTRKLIEYIRDIDPAAKLHVAIREGEHGFDFSASVKDDWMREGLGFIATEWIKKD